MASTLARQGIGPVLGPRQLADLAAALWLPVVGSTFLHQRPARAFVVLICLF